MCNKVDHRVECQKCGYSLSEALFPDDTPPLSCHITFFDLMKYLKRVNIEHRYISS